MIMFKIYIYIYIHLYTQISWMANRWSTESVTAEKATGFQGAVTSDLEIKGHQTMCVKVTIAIALLAMTGLQFDYSRPFFGVFLLVLMLMEVTKTRKMKVISKLR